jgi:hypothetical protein
MSIAIAVFGHKAGLKMGTIMHKLLSSKANKKLSYCAGLQNVDPA